MCFSPWGHRESDMTYPQINNIKYSWEKISIIYRVSNLFTKFICFFPVLALTKVLCPECPAVLGKAGWLTSLFLNAQVAHTRHLNSVLHLKGSYWNTAELPRDPTCSYSPLPLQPDRGPDPAGRHPCLLSPRPQQGSLLLRHCYLRAGASE